MHDWPLKIRLFHKPRFIPLRFRFIFLTAGMLIVLLGTLALVLGFIQSRTIRRQLEERGVAIAQSLAATSTANLLTYNYIALEQSANQAIRDPDIVYAVFHDKEGRVAGFSDRPDLQNTLLTDPVTRNALEAETSLIQEVFVGTDTVPGLDIAVPVYPSGAKERWGTVRICLSLAAMYQQIRQMQWIILVMGLVSLALGTIVSILAARRVTLPLGNLVNGTVEAARGNLDPDIRVETGDEVAVLAANFSVMIREILSHRQQLERQLAEIKRLQQYTEKLLITMSDGLLSVNMAAEVSTINPAACRLLDLLPDDIQKGAPIGGVLKESPALNEFIQEMVKNPLERNQQELRLQRTDTAQFILVGSSLLRDKETRPRELIFTLHDITELKKLEAHIRQTERLAALGTLAAGMAHEIRNPLSAIKTFVQLLPRKMDNPDFVEKFNRTVPRELNRINALVEDLLELARTPKYQYAVTQIPTLLDQTMDFVGEELRSHGIHYQFESADPLPPVWADPNQLIKAFQNLIRNAVQAMPVGGRLTIATRRETASLPAGGTRSSDDEITILFRDTGTGMTPETIKAIFNPFFTTRDKGTGLGLAITHKVITEHGGRIEVDSRVDGGTCFIIHLPVQKGSDGPSN